MISGKKEEARNALTEKDMSKKENFGLCNQCSLSGPKVVTVTVMVKNVPMQRRIIKLYCREFNEFKSENNCDKFVR